ncbi:MAG: hypothetical protein WC438_02890 [Candidatus Pacearchaeota archaeon]
MNEWLAENIQDPQQIIKIFQTQSEFSKSEKYVVITIWYMGK